MSIKTSIAAGVCSASVVAGAYIGLYNMDTKISQQGVELIVDAEGCRTVPYYCQAGILTAGVGSTTGIVKGKVYTVPEVVGMLRKDLLKVETCLAISVNVPLTQGEYDGWASFIFNHGCGSFRSSTARELLNSGNHIAACQQIPRWNKVKVNGKFVVSKGQVRRKANEERVCLSQLR